MKVSVGLSHLTSMATAERCKVYCLIRPQYAVDSNSTPLAGSPENWHFVSVFITQVLYGYTLRFEKHKSHQTAHAVNHEEQRERSLLEAEGIKRRHERPVALRI